MKKKGIFILTLLMMILFSVNSFADSIDSASNYFAFKENVNITEDVSGDIYSAGREVNVENSVVGDTIAAGEIINIKSKEIRGNVRCAAQTLNIDSKNIKNITCAGQNIDIGKNTTAKKTVLELAKEVIAGKWGNGQDRKNRLTASGYDYTAVQNKVNELLN